MHIEKVLKNFLKRNKQQEQQDFELVECKFNRFSNVHQNTTSHTTDDTKVMSVSSMVNSTEINGDDDGYDGSHQHRHKAVNKNNPNTEYDIVNLDFSNYNDTPLVQWDDVMNSGQHLLKLSNRNTIEPVSFMCTG
ncbi:unnamed protein product [Schistosoma turkestanicum]|nr:unnamed protein product [Schistosoma turkestanicum]